MRSFRTLVVLAIVALFCATFASAVPVFQAGSSGGSSGGGSSTPAPAGTPAVASTPVTGASTWTAPSGWSQGDIMETNVFDSSGEGGFPTSTVTNMNGGIFQWQTGVSVGSDTDNLYDWVSFPGFASMAGLAQAAKNAGGSLLDSFVWDISCAASGGNVLVDQEVATQGGTGTTQTCPTSTLNTKQNNELIVYYGHHLGAASSTPATGTGITAWGNSTTGSGASATLSVPGAVPSATMNSAASGNHWTCATITYYCSK